MLNFLIFLLPGGGESAKSEAQMGRQKKDRAMERARAKELQKKSDDGDDGNRKLVKGRQKREDLETLADILQRGIDGMEWIQAHWPEHVLAVMLAWCGALLSWCLVDSGRSLSHVLQLRRRGWSWQRAMATFRPPEISKYFGLQLSDISNMSDDEYDGLYNKA